ncbi:MAG: PAS domain S-box protein, partial [Deltaproteobacteria bacterium]|nr:PAS domain S-box protein [Deltaproteobacteria bacterium]
MLQASIRERFGCLLAGAGQMFWELDQNFRVLYANELLKRVFGDPEGMTCHEFMSGSPQVCPGCPAKRVMQGQDRAVSERLRVDKHGNPTWLQLTAIPIRNEQGEIVGASELIVDTTHRKLAEESLRESQRMYRNLVEQVPDVIFSLDQSGRFSFVNTEVEKFLGYPVQQVLETPLKDYVVPQDQHRIEAMFQLGPEAIWDEEVGVLDSQGNKKFARIRCKITVSEEDGSLSFEGVMRDRTIRRKLEEELKASKSALVEKIKIIDELYEHIIQQQKFKAIEEHTAEVAHELRQPLAIVGGFARRLARQLSPDKEPDREKQRQYVDIIITEIFRLERILDSLIEFTRRNAITKQKVNPNALIEYILGITSARMTDKEIKLETNLGPEIGEVPLDPGRFQQLVLNLVSNAIEASPVGGVIYIESGISIPSDKALKTGELESAGFFEMKVRNEGLPIPA